MAVTLEVKGTGDMFIVEANKLVYDCQADYQRLWKVYYKLFKDMGMWDEDAKTYADAKAKQYSHDIFIFWFMKEHNVADAIAKLDEHNIQYTVKVIQEVLDDLDINVHVVTIQSEGIDIVAVKKFE